MHHSAPILASAICVSAALLTARPTFAAPSTPQPVTSVENVVRDLGSVDPALRSAAHVALLSLRPSDLEMLRKMATESKDKDPKSVLNQAVRDLEDELAFNPPSLSIHVKDASLAEVLTILNAQMDGKLRLAEPASTDPPRKYTLDLDHGSYFDVMNLLKAQNGSLPINLFPSAPNPVSATLRSQDRLAGRGFACVFSVRRYQNGGIPGKWSALGCAISCDPRVTVLRASNGTITEIKDEKENDLLAAVGGAVPDTPLGEITPSPERRWSFGANLPEPLPAKSIHTKAKFTLEVLVTATRLELDDVAPVLNQPLAFGPGQVTFIGYEKPDRGLQTAYFVMTLPPGANDLQNGDSFLPLYHEFLDASGWRTHSNLTVFHKFMALPVNDSKVGRHALVGATRRKIIELTIDVKDVPVPTTYELMGSRGDGPFR